MHNPHIFMLAQEVYEERESQSEAVIVQKGLRGNFLIDLLLALEHVLYVIKTQSWNYHVELFEMFVFLGRYLGAGLYHQVEVINLFSKLLV